MTGTPEAQKKYYKKWTKENATRRRYTNLKSETKKFILERAEPEDIELVKEWLAEREKNML